MASAHYQKSRIGRDVSSAKQTVLSIKNNADIETSNVTAPNSTLTTITDLQKNKSQDSHAATLINKIATEDANGIFVYRGSLNKGNITNTEVSNRQYIYKTRYGLLYLGEKWQICLFNGL